MTILDFKQKALKIGFEEQPKVNTGNEPSLESFVKFDDSDIDLKIYLAKLNLCRCFSPSGGIYWPNDSKWFISNSLRTFDTDLIKPQLTDAIKKVIAMIIGEDTFVEGIIGTTFMFGIIEFYAKSQLGWDPNQYDYCDDTNQKYYRTMYIGDAVNKIKKTNTELAKSLNEIDNYSIQFLKIFAIKEGRHIRARIADRLTLARNTMLHGERHTFYDKGEYLITLYFLFHFHELKKDIR